MKAALLRQFESLYRLIFKHEMSPAVKEFFSNISWSFVGGIISAATLMIISILAGRLLGPTEYGKFAFIAAVGQIIFAFLVLGMDKASMRFIAQAKNKLVKAKNLSTALQFIVLVSLVFSLIYFLIHQSLAEFFGFEEILLLVALLYALFLSFRQIFNNFIRGLQNFKFQTIARILESFLILVFFAALFYFSDNNTYKLYIFSLIGGYAFFILFCTYKLKSYFVPFDKKVFKKQFSFAKIYFIAVILGVLFGSLDKIVIGKYMSFYDLGIYGAYYAAALNFTAQLNNVFGNVFFPALSKNLDKAHLIIRKVDRLTLLMFLPVFILVMGTTTIFILLFGSAYPLKLVYIFSFSLLAIFNMIFSINGLMVSVYSRQTIKTTTIIGNIMNLVFVGIFLLLVFTLGLSIQLVVTVLIVYNIAEIIMCKYVLHREGAYRP